MGSKQKQWKINISDLNDEFKEDFDVILSWKQNQYLIHITAEYSKQQSKNVLTDRQADVGI